LTFELLISKISVVFSVDLEEPLSFFAEALFESHFLDPVSDSMAIAAIQNYKEAENQGNRAD
jgi:hypothetical protein